MNNSICNNTNKNLKNSRCSRNNKLIILKQSSSRESKVPRYSSTTNKKQPNNKILFPDPRQLI